MEGPFPIDVWQLHVAPRLDVRSLCALMVCSRASFCFWSSNRSWQWQMQRILKTRPELQLLFDAYACDADLYVRENREVVTRQQRKLSKKLKTPWLMPTRGIWFVFSRFLSLGFYMRGFKELCRHATRSTDRDVDEIALTVLAAIVRSHVPRGERLEQWRITRYDGMQYFRISASMAMSIFEVIVHRGEEEIMIRMRPGDAWSVTPMRVLYEADEHDEPNWWFDAWLYFVLDIPGFNSYWTDHFDMLMMNDAEVAALQ